MCIYPAAPNLAVVQTIMNKILILLPLLLCTGLSAQKATAIKGPSKPCGRFAVRGQDLRITKLPILGKTLELTTSPANFGHNFLAFGPALSTPFLLPTPPNGCRLEVAPVVMVWFMRAVHRFPVPNNAALAGATISVQHLGNVKTRPPFHVVLTRVETSSSYKLTLGL